MSSRHHITLGAPWRWHTTICTCTSHLAASSNLPFHGGWIHKRIVSPWSSSLCWLFSDKNLDSKQNFYFKWPQNRSQNHIKLFGRNQSDIDGLPRYSHSFHFIIHSLRNISQKPYWKLFTIPNGILSRKYVCYRYVVLMRPFMYQVNKRHSSPEILKLWLQVTVNLTYIGLIVKMSKLYYLTS